MRGKFSIKMQIFGLYTLIFTLVFLLFSAIILTDYTELSLRATKNNIERELDLLTNSLDVLLSDCEEYLRVISTDRNLVYQVEAYKKNPDMKENDQIQIKNQINAILSNIVAPNTKLLAAYVVVDDEVLGNVYGIREESIKNILTNENVKKIETSSRPVWEENLHELKFQGQKDQMVFLLSRAIMNKDTGKKLGIITLCLPEQTVSDIYERNTVDKNKYYLLNQGTILSASDKFLLNKPYGENMPNKEWTFNRSYGKLGWEIVCEADKSIFEQAGKHTVVLTIHILLIFIAAVLASSFYISFRITRPLYSLLDVMKEIENGNTKARSNYCENNEFGKLSVEFNKLVDEQERAKEHIYMHQKARRKSELLLLQSQIKPHFLYNTMESIASFVRLGYKELALEAIQSLSLFYRKSLSMGKEIVQVKDELVIIEEYLKIQSLRYQDYMEYTIDVDDGILGYQIPKLTLQPIVENAIYHGLKQKDEKGEIIIRGYEQDEMLCLEVFDTGIGMTEAQQQELEKKIRDLSKTSERGFGLYNVMERLHLFYEDGCAMQIDSEYNEYTQITIQIPKKEG